MTSWEEHDENLYRQIAAGCRNCLVSHVERPGGSFGESSGQFRRDVSQRAIGAAVDRCINDRFYESLRNPVRPKISSHDDIHALQPLSLVGGWRYHWTRLIIRRN